MKNIFTIAVALGLSTFAQAQNTPPLNDHALAISFVEGLARTRNKPFVVFTTNADGQVDAQSVAVAYAQEKPGATRNVEPAAEKKPEDGNSMAMGVEFGLHGPRGGALRIGARVLNQFLETSGLVGVMGGPVNDGVGGGFAFGGKAEVAPLAFQGIKSVYVSGRYLYVIDLNDSSVGDDYDNTATILSYGAGFRKKISSNSGWWDNDNKALYFFGEVGRIKSRGWYVSVGFSALLK
jgi:hypothetical protein